MKFLLKYASRSRPALFKKRWNNWDDLASDAHEIHWLASFHADDPTMNNPEMLQWCAERGIETFVSDARTKVQNYNAGIGETKHSWDVLILVSDDMVMLQSEWDQHIVADFCGNLDQGLWYADGQNDRVNCLSVMGRPIYEMLGSAYDPQFESVYCDDYYQWRLQKLGKLKRVKRDGLLIRHEWKRENNDALMQATEDRVVYARDKLTFERLTA